MKYQVYIEGVQAPGSEALVAAAIAKCFGLPPDALIARMAQGRFRVKKDIERFTAEQFAAELEALGASASVTDEHGRPVENEEETLSLMPEAPAMSAPMPAQPAPADSPFAGITAERSAVQPEATGLAAAAGGAQQDLGALGGDFALSVSSIDGAAQPESKAKPEAAFAPPTEAAFLPPDALEEQTFEVDAPVLARPTTKEIAHEPSPAAMEALVGGADASLGEGAAPRDNPLRRLWDRLNEDSRARFAAGILLVTLLGFLPAHVYATMTENTAYSEMRTSLSETQALVEDEAEWTGLDVVRSETLSRMDKKRVNIAIISTLLWGVVAGGLGFVWFRKLPWDDNRPRIA